MLRKFLIFVICACTSYFLIAGNIPLWENLLVGPDMSIEVDANSLSRAGGKMRSKFRVNFYDEARTGNYIQYTLERECQDERIFVVESLAYYDGELVERNLARSELRFITSVFATWFETACIQAR